MKAHRANISDAPAIYALIAYFAGSGLLLPRTEEEIHRNISHFLVHKIKGRVVSCVALESYGPDLAEIRSLAVASEMHGRGIGARLLEFALTEARRREIARVFAVTHAPEFFLHRGFAGVSRHSLRQKIERDCHACPKRRSCKLVAVVATIIPECVTLPILNDSAAPVSIA
jgi:N-acetylglutamate synthase-like GNAT family acetyltransferase